MPMLSNKDISKIFDLTASLIELYDINPFKAKSYATAAYQIKKMDEPLFLMDEKKWPLLSGVGRGLLSKLSELKTTGKLEETEELASKTPKGIIEMMGIHGLGPKKIKIIWKELGVETVGELLYACNENKLVNLSGFGEKTQEKIAKAISFFSLNEGKLRLDSALELIEEAKNWIKKLDKKAQTHTTGMVRRNCEIVDVLEIVLIPSDISLYKDFEQITFLNDDSFILKLNETATINVHVAAPENLGNRLFDTTRGIQFNELKSPDEDYPTELDVFNHLNINFIEPELRDLENILEKAAQNKLPKLIEFEDLKGVLHNHSTWSDGIHSIKEMAEFAQKNNWDYLGISDHSKAAFYANGLSTDRLKEQWKEIDELNSLSSDFKIFKGIESDILFDGNLDYPTEILAGFDFIVASIHSILNMDIAKATQRLITAIENPYTTILGHPTGRLILSREGYPIDHKAVIDACAAANVVIEINANPHRLDLDWRWIDYTLSQNVMLAINPDAHKKQSFFDMKYGIMNARKGGLTSAMTLNALNLNEIDSYFNHRKSMIKS